MKNNILDQSSIMEFSMKQKMIDLEVQAGSYLDNTIEGVIAGLKIAEKAGNRGCIARIDFNGVMLLMSAKSVVKEVVEYYHYQLKLEWQAYVNSPEYKWRKQLEEAQIERLMSELEVIMAQLEYMDLSNIDHVLSWLNEIQPYSDDSRLKVPAKHIAKVLRSHGYLRDVNCNENFKEDNKENVARYLVGQALDGLEYRGAIHSMYCYFYPEWQEKFLGIKEPFYRYGRRTKRPEKKKCA